NVRGDRISPLRSRFLSCWICVLFWLCFAPCFRFYQRLPLLVLFALRLLHRAHATIVRVTTCHASQLALDGTHCARSRRAGRSAATQTFPPRRPHPVNSIEQENVAPIRAAKKRWRIPAWSCGSPFAGPHVTHFHEAEAFMGDRHSIPPTIRKLYHTR